MRAYRGDIPKLPILSLLELWLLDRRWRRETATLPPEAPWSASRALEWDAQSTESWILKHVHTPSTREVVRTVVRALMCAEPAQVSYLNLLEYLRQEKSLEVLIGTRGGAQQDKFLGGGWQISKRMADQLGHNIMLQAPVLSIEQRADCVSVTAPQGGYAAKRLIMTLPPGLAAQVHYTQPLPSRRFGLI